LATRPPIRVERMTLNWLAIGLASRISCSLPAKSRFPGFFDEGEVDHFLIAAISQHLPTRATGRACSVCGNIASKPAVLVAGMFS
jgi:hypothetical protein